MKKALKIGIISFTSLVVVFVTTLFFQLDILFMFIKGDNGTVSNYEVDGSIKTGKVYTDIELNVDGNKIKAEIGGLDFYIEDSGTTKYIYSKGIFGGWVKTTLKTEDDKTAFVSIIEDIERDDFTFKTIGYYEMKQEKLDEHNLEAMSITFKTDGILLKIKYNDNLSYSIFLSDFGKEKVTLPN